MHTHTHTRNIQNSTFPNNFTAKRNYPTSEVRGGGREELPHAPTPEATGGGWEEQPHVQGALAAPAQEGLEELSNVEGQEGRR